MCWGDALVKGSFKNTYSGDLGRILWKMSTVSKVGELWTGVTLSNSRRVLITWKSIREVELTRFPQMMHLIPIAFSPVRSLRGPYSIILFIMAFKPSLWEHWDMDVWKVFPLIFCSQKEPSRYKRFTTPRLREISYSFSIS